MKVNVINGEISEKEKQEYIAYIGKKYDVNYIKELTIKLDGDYVEISTSFIPAEFERVRRVTGYLNTKDRFNDAKQAEVADRVPHGFDDDYSRTSSGLLEEG